MQISQTAYSTNWPELFSLEKRKIAHDFPLKPVHFEHIGSTAIENLPAHPVIDILVGLAEMPCDLDPVVAHLATLQYEYVPDLESVIPERRFFRKEIIGGICHHIHMVMKDGQFWKRHLYYRDELRNSRELRLQYERLRVELSKEHWPPGNEFVAIKSDFIRMVEEEFV